MKKLIPWLLVALLVVSTAPALAGDGDVQFYADKTIFLDEFFSYYETVTFTGTGTFEFNSEAWAKVQEQQELYYNYLNEFSFEFATKSATISTGSYVDGSGVANVNQSPGNLNNQSNEVAISLASPGLDLGSPAEPGTFGGMFCEAQIVTVQYNGIFYDPATDTRAAAGNILFTDGFVKTDTINASFAGWDGVVGVNQGAGSLNNQGNAVAIAGGVDGVAVKAASNVMLAQNSAYNNMEEGTTFNVGNFTADSINTDSFDGATGVIGINQAAGSLNNQKNATAIAFGVVR